MIRNLGEISEVELKKDLSNLGADTTSQADMMSTSSAPKLRQLYLW